MKIDINPRIRPNSARRGDKASAQQKAGFDKHLSEFESSLPLGVTPLTTPILETFFLLQEINQEASPHEKARKHGENILQGLESLKLDLSLGNIPLKKLQDLADALKARPEFEDKNLQEILAEIELRAHVELAKLNYLSNPIN